MLRLSRPNAQMGEIFAGFSEKGGRGSIYTGEMNQDDIPG